MLQAVIPRIPGRKGPCRVSLYIKDGEVISCWIEDVLGGQSTLDKEFLCRLDNAKGPFEWIFHQQAVTPQKPAQQIVALSPASHTSLTPIVIANLDQKRLEPWLPAQRQILLEIWMLIDGKRTVDDIKAAAPSYAHLVEEIVQIFQSLQLIVLR